MALAVHPSVPAQNLKEFVAYAKTHAGKLSYAHVGVGSTPQRVLSRSKDRSNPVLHCQGGKLFESPMRHRTVRSKGCLSNKTALAMIFKLAEAAERSWRRLNGHNQLPKIILGIKFTDGIEVVRSQAQTAAA